MQRLAIRAKTRRMRGFQVDVLLPTIAAVCLVTACGGAGPFGYAREYVALDDEETHMLQASAITYEEVRRDPDEFLDRTVGWFGVVTQVDLEGDGAATVAATFRTHQARHLCRDETASSCRVTVSEREGGPFSSRLQLRPEDRDGRDRLWVGSLIKVYGAPTGAFDEEGGPVLEADWYRHWPRGTYVTTGAASSMRR